MNPRVLRALRIAAVSIGALILAWLLFAWLAFEPLLKWAVPRHLAQHGGYVLSIGEASLHPLRLAASVRDVALREPGGQPLLALARLEVNLDAGGLFRRAWSFDEVRLEAPVVTLELRQDGRLNWLDFVTALSDPAAPAAPPGAAPPRLLVRRLAIADGALDLTDRHVSGGFHTRADALALELHRLSTLPDDRGDHTLSVQTGVGATVRWRGEFGLNPVQAGGDVSVDGLQLERLWPYLRETLHMEPPQGEAALRFAYRVGYAQGRLDLALERVEARLAGLALRSAGAAQPALALDALTLAGGRLDLASRRVSFERVQVGPGRVALRRAADGRLDVQDWLRPRDVAAAGPAPARAASAPPAASTSASAPAWQVQLDDFAVQGLGLQLTDHGFATPLTAAVSQARLGLRLKAQAGGSGAPAFEVEDASAQVDGFSLAAEGEREPWFSLASATLDRARVASDHRGVAAGVLALRGGRLRVERDAAGRVALAERLKRRDAAAPDRPPAAASPANDGPMRLEALQLHDFAIALKDASVQPALAIGITDLQAEAKGLSRDLDAAVPVSLQLRVDRGGRLEARGRVVPGAPAADLQLALNDLSLVPAQPYVARATTLKLSGGRAATQGRLRVDAKGWRYDGGFDVRGVRFDEAATGDRFLSWDRLHSPSLAASAQGLRMRELRADGLGAKLVVARDRSVNVAQVMRPAASKPTTPARAPASAAGVAPPYAFAIDRIRVAGGSVDFADLSLALPFGTRIHELQGQLVGLANRGTAPAQVELEGKVDDYGLARAAGQVRLFDPTAFTDLKVVFRNVEMAHLTPYAATFAGRRIASGKLSLDLEYKLQQRRLAGENRVVMDKLVLGERVESPSALDLPLDLAIAILQDAEGRIDLGIPVSGSLDDPQFSYGQLIGKAIANLLTRIVTAPFRALGALLGGGAGEQALESVAFDAGRSDLLPPEREKLAKVAAALARRPGLAVSVQPRFDPQGDAQALRERALRAAVARATGHSVAAGEEPGPVSTADPATRAALETLYTRRFGLGELVALRQRGGEMHGAMLQRLVQAQAVDEGMLRALAGSRGTAIQAELAARGVAPQRLQVGAVEPAAPGDGRVVRSTLGLAAAAAASAAAASASAAGR